jgi:hypothetical protein
MDNKENRQFYWEVKQFVNGNHTPKASEVKKPSVKDAISGVLSENDVYKQNNFVKNTRTNDVVRSYLNVLGTQEKKNTPETIMFTKNSTLNPFNILNEAEARTLPPQVMERPKSREDLEREAAKDQQRERRRQDDLQRLKDELDSSGVVGYDSKDYDNPDLTADELLTKIGSSARKELYTKRSEREKEKTIKNLTTRLQKFEGKDLNKLSQEELRDLAGIQFSIKNSGFNVEDDPDTAEDESYSLEKQIRQRTQQRFAKEQAKKMGPNFGPEEISTKRTEGLMKGVLDTDRDFMKEFQQQSQARIKAEQEEKARNTAISPGYGSVTPASFEAAYGVAYDPRNPKHGTMIQALHGENTGKYIQGAGTVSGWKDVMGQQRYSDLTKEREQKVRGAQEKIDAIKFDIDKHKAMTPAERTAENAAERAELLKSKPEAFMKELDVQDIYQNKGGLNTPVEVPSWEARKGMSQRAVASKASTMFGSGRGALGPSNRMNA